MNHSFRISFISAAICVIVTIIIAQEMALPTTFAKGKPGGGSDQSATQNCILFDDLTDDKVRSDGGDGLSPYCDDKSAKVAVTFTSDGHLVFDSNNSNKAGAGRSLYIDFGEVIEIDDAEGGPQFFSSTDDLDDMGALHSVTLQLGAFQNNFDLFAMQVGETRRDVNLQIALHILFEGQNTYSGVRIALSPVPVDNDRYFPGSDPVCVTFIGDPDNDGVAEWRVETSSIDNDLDGLIDEDPVDGIDNDGDGLVDEDGDAGFAAVTQSHFATDPEPVTVGLIPVKFGFTLSAPY